MLTKFRNISNSLILKVLLGALALSFILFGIGTRTSHNNYAAIVGKKGYIYKADLIKAKKNFLSSINQTNTKSPTDNAYINQMVLNTLVQNELLKAEANNLELYIGDNITLSELKKNDAFKNKDGQFDKKIFKKILEVSGIIETDLINNIKQDIAINILTSIFAPYKPSNHLINAFYQYNEQKRLIDLITIKPLHSYDYTPNSKEIESYYSNNKEKFRIPEERDIEFITINPSMYRDHIKLTEEELKANKQNINKVTEDLISAKAEKAMHNDLKAIEDEIAAGNTLKEISNTHKLKNSVIEKVTHSQKEVLHKNLPTIENYAEFLEQSFSLDENSPSDILQVSSTDYSIINVNKIYKSYYKSLDDSIRSTIISTIKKDHQERLQKKEALDAYNDILSKKKTLSQLPNVISVSQIVLKSNKNSGINADLMKNIFSIRNKNDYTGIFKSKDQDTFQFAIVKEIRPPDPLTRERKKAIAEQLSAYFTSAINQEFISYLHTKHKVKIFPEALTDL